MEIDTCTLILIYIRPLKSLIYRSKVVTIFMENIKDIFVDNIRGFF